MTTPEAEVPPYPAQHLLMQPIRRAAAERGDPDHLDLWSGQAAALTRRSRTARGYVADLLAEADRVLGDGPARAARVGGASRTP